MNKGVVVGGVVLVGALLWLLLLKPEPVPQTPRPQPVTPVAAPAPVVDAAVGAKPKPKPVDAAVVAPPDAEIVEVDAEKPSGPIVVDLGEHQIHLKERDRRVVEIHAKITTESAITAREIRGRKRNLVRMMFFLGTHRAADSAAADVGGANFKATLEARFRNVIKTGSFQLSFDRFEVFELPDVDAGP